jgi:hypothetical protein
MDKIGRDISDWAETNEWEETTKRERESLEMKGYGT